MFRKGLPLPYSNSSQAPQSGSSRSLAQAARDQMVHYTRVNMSSYGVPIPIIYGTNRVAPTILWFGDQTTTTVVNPAGTRAGQNNVALELGLAEGPIRAVLQSWVTGGGAGAGVTQRIGAGQTINNWTLIPGSYSDIPWIWLTTNHPSEALAYRGIAKLVQTAVNLGQNKQLPQFNFEIQGLLPFSTTIFDAEPSAIIEDLLVEPHHGGEFPIARLDLNGTWLDYKAANIAVGLFISPILDTQQSLAQSIQKWLDITLAQAVWSDGKLKIVPFYDTPTTANGVTFAPVLNPVIPSSGPDDYVVSKAEEPLSVVRALPADKFNEVRIEYVNRAHGYQVEVTYARSQADIELYQKRVAQPVQYHEITTQLTATKVARMQLLRGLTVRNQYHFKLAQKYIWLDPLDIWPLTSPELGLSNLPVRIISIELDNNEELQVVAEDLGVCNAVGLVGGEQTGGAQRTGVNPLSVQPVNDPVLVEPTNSITYGKLLLWFGVSGQGGDLNWGGADIYWSEDNISFKRLLSTDVAATSGVLLADYPASQAFIDTNTLQIDLSQSSGTVGSIAKSLADARHNLAILCDEDGTNVELISFDTVTAGSADFQWNLTNIRRGLYKSGSTAHLAGTKFLFLDYVSHLDPGVFTWEYPARLIGNTIYFKMLSWDESHGTVQQLTDPTVVSYPYTLQGNGSTAQTIVTNFAVGQVTFRVVATLNGKTLSGQLLNIEAFGTFICGPVPGTKCILDIFRVGDTLALFQLDLTPSLSPNASIPFDLATQTIPTKGYVYQFRVTLNGSQATGTISQVDFTMAIVNPNVTSG